MVAHITVALDRHERWCSPRVLGNRLNLRDRERQQYGIRHIRPIDVSDEELIDRRKAKARARERQRRLKSGGRSREDYLANSLSRQKPWLAQGMSRARWYRLKRETGACAMSLPLQRTDLSQLAWPAWQLLVQSRCHMMPATLRDRCLRHPRLVRARTCLTIHLVRGRTQCPARGRNLWKTSNLQNRDRRLRGSTMFRSFQARL